MTLQFLTKGQLHRLLKAGGHAFWSPEPVDDPIDVSPPVETYLTVAFDADGALKPAYRARYFACRRDVADDPVILRAAKFAFSAAIAAAVAGDPRNNDFVLGPFRWLLARVQRFDRALLWPKGGFRGDDGLGFLLTTAGGARLDQAPHLANWLRDHTPNPAQVAAMVVDPSDLADCQAIWEAGNLVGADGHDFFLSDSAGCEVYQMHHHDKVVVSIPDGPARQELLAQLAGQPDVFEDCSGYVSTSDEELFER